MFNWLGNLFPYSDLHSLNLDWILSKMKETAAQAAQAIADSAKALAQVAEAKAAALSAQTAAQNAQTAANNAQTAANNAADSAENAVAVAQAAKSAAQTAQNTANTAQSAAQTAQNTANTAQSAAETAQSAAETAQSAAQTAQNTANTAQSATENANTEINALKAKFPIKAIDIEASAVTPGKLETKNSYLFTRSSGTGVVTFPESGSANIDQIKAGISVAENPYYEMKTNYLQFRMDITENGAPYANTVFNFSAPPVRRILLLSGGGLMAIAPFIIIKEETNDMYNGFIKLSLVASASAYDTRCEVFFKTEPPFNENTKFVITACPVGAEINYHI